MEVQVLSTAPFQKPLYLDDTAAFIVFLHRMLGSLGDRLNLLLIGSGRPKRIRTSCLSRW